MIEKNSYQTSDVNEICSTIAKWNLEDLFTNVEELEAQSSDIKKKLSVFTMRLSQTSTAFKQLTETMRKLLDPMQWIEINHELQNTNSALTKLSTEISVELPEAMEQHLVALKQAEVRLGVRTGKIRPDLTSESIRREIGTLKQNHALACCETWLLLVTKFGSELQVISKVCRQLQPMLLDMRLRSQGHFRSHHANIDNADVASSSVVRHSLKLPSQVNGTVTQSKSSNCQGKYGAIHNSCKPDRPLRARELDAIGELPFSQQIVPERPNSVVNQLVEDLQFTPFRSNALSSLNNNATSHANSSCLHSSAVADLLSSSSESLPGYSFRRIDLTQPKGTVETSSTQQHIQRERSLQSVGRINEPDQRRFPLHTNQAAAVINVRYPSACDVRIIRIGSKGKLGSANDLSVNTCKRSNRALSSNRLAEEHFNNIKPMKSKRPVDDKKHFGTPCDMVIATHSYVAQDLDELSLNKDDVLRVLPWPKYMEEESDWLYGERTSDGKQGVFPKNFTKYF